MSFKLPNGVLKWSENVRMKMNKYITTAPFVYLRIVVSIRDCTGDACKFSPLYIHTTTPIYIYIDHLSLP